MGYVSAALLVAVVLFATYRGLDWWTRRRVARHLNDPDEILTAARIYASYGRRQAARELLEAGLARHPEHPGLRTRLAELGEDA